MKREEKRKLISKHLSDAHKQSIESYMKTGHVSGSLLIDVVDLVDEVERLTREIVKQETLELLRKLGSAGVLEMYSDGSSFTRHRKGKFTCDSIDELETKLREI